MTEPDFRFSLRVYWEDTDAGGVVFYANYLKFFERARTEWLRSLGFSQEQMRHSLNVMFIVSELSVNYLKPARLDDLLEVDVTLEVARAASLVLSQQAWRATQREPELLGRSQIRIACVNAQTLQPRRIPQDLLHRLK
jgi:acyl-CoA thioester hydrolase